MYDACAALKELHSATKIFKAEENLRRAKQDRSKLLEAYDGPVRPSQFAQKEEDKQFIKGVKNIIKQQLLSV